MVRGRKITVTDVVIVEVSGLPVVGPVWTQKKVRLQDAITISKDKGQSLTVKGK